MSVVLPKEIQYTTLPILPSGAQSIECAISPINCASVDCTTSGGVLQFDIASRGFLQQSSMYLKYKYAITSGTAGDVCKIRSTPATAAFAKLELIANSTTIETIANYHVIENMKTNCSMSPAGKHGVAGYMGWRSENEGAAVTLEGMDGRHLLTTATGGINGGIGESGYMAFPVSCLLTKADKMFPLGLGPPIRLQFTMAGINDVFGTCVAATIDNALFVPVVTVGILPTAFTISDITLCYTLCDLGSDVENMIKSQGEKILIKSESFMSSSQTVPTGSLGMLDLSYSMRLASCKSLFLHSSSSGINGIFDSFNIAGAAGDYLFLINSKSYPARPINVTNRTYLLELKKAISSIFDTSMNQFSISNSEIKNLAASSTIAVPSKVYIGVNTEILPSNLVLLSGTSTNNSQIIARINIGTATVSVFNCSLLANFDAVLELDPITKTLICRQ